MIRQAILPIAVLFAFGAAPAGAQIVLDMSLITCRQFLDSPPERQEMITAWMGGYYSASKNLSTVDFRYVERNHKAVISYCKKNAREGLLSVVQKVSR